MTEPPKMTLRMLPERSSAENTLATAEFKRHPGAGPQGEGDMTTPQLPLLPATPRAAPAGAELPTGQKETPSSPAL